MSSPDPGPAPSIVGPLAAVTMARFGRLMKDLGGWELARSEGVPTPPEMVSAYVRLASEHSDFMVGIATDAAGAADISEALIGEKIDDETLAWEAVVEVANMLGGIVKESMLGLGMASSLEIGLPFLIHGEVSGPAIRESASACLASTGREIHLMVHRIETPDHRERGRLRHQLSDREQRLQALLDGVADGIIICDSEGLMDLMNPAALEMFGVASSQIAELSMADLVPGWSGSNAQQLEAKPSTGRAAFPVELSFGAFSVAGRELNAVVVRDITERKEQENQLRSLNRSLREEADELRRARDQIMRLANFDHLTGLPNRRYLESLLQRVMRNLDDSDEQVAVLSIDLDRFKQINDTIGHKGGDEALRVAAARLSDALRGTDFVGRRSHDSRVARLGGDEFVVVLVGVRRTEDVRIVAQRLLERMSKPLVIEGHEFSVSASIGIAMCDNGDASLEELLDHADAAMYAAKGSGRAGFEFYTGKLSEQTQRRIWIERELKRALDEERLEAYYQPRVEVGTRRVLGAEALARWRLEDGTFVSPGEFVPIAEECGLVGRLGRVMLEKAVRDAKRMADMGRPMTFSVNVAPAQLGPAFLEQVRDNLAKHNLDPQHLELEITERTLLDGREEIRQVLSELAEMGISLAVDDFGTGYASLSYLARFPVDTLKIDRSFIDQVTKHDVSATITSAIIALGRSLGTNIVAEGVETEEQLAFLARHRCREAQGYLFCRPVPFDVFRDWVAQFESLRQTVA